MPTPWRRNLYKEIEKLEITGKVIDLGGSRKSGYHELIKGDHKIEVVNIDDKSGLDLKFDLEKSFPIKDNIYDAVLLFNVLEHIYDHKQLLKESLRILKSGGRIIIGVPFLMYVHPSPNDYWRYTDQTLLKLLEQGNFSNIKVIPIGRGPCTAGVQLLSGIVSFAPIRGLLEWCAIAVDSVLALFVGTDKIKARYPLGYMVIAKK